MSDTGLPMNVEHRYERVDVGLEVQVRYSLCKDSRRGATDDCCLPRPTLDPESLVLKCYARYAVPCHIA